MIEYNYLDLLNKRRLNYLPEHFLQSKLQDKDFFVNCDKILSWIRCNLKGRFSLVSIPMISNNEKLKSEYVIAFENHSELTYFLLACPYVRRTS
jgi:hypothetical protein